MALSTLNEIRNKVRRLTRSPSTAQLSQAELDNYINTFVIYDFPEQLRLFNLKTTFTFYTNPYQDEYATDIDSFAGAITNPLYNFQNKYLTMNPPVYIAGYQAFFTQSREQFFAIYPFTNSIASTQLVGDGVTTTFTGVINTAQSFTLPGQINQNVGLLQRNVLFSSIDVGGIGLSMVDAPVIDPATGYLFSVGSLYEPGVVPYNAPAVLINNQVNYATGTFTVTFSSAPAAGQPIISQTVPQITSLPQALLFYENKFTVRPVPNISYKVNFEVFARPVELISSGQSPQLEEWWQYLSLGAARKILQDRLDMETVQLLEPEFREQEALCLRRTLVQLSNQRTATIYTEQASFGQGNGGWGFGGPF
jgi:hypothetical protein